MASPVMRFLGLDGSPDALDLLQLSVEECSSGAIDQALQTQLHRVYRHPDSESDEAKQVIRALHEAAEIVRDPARRERIWRARLAPKTPVNEAPTGPASPTPVKPATASPSGDPAESPRRLPMHPPGFPTPGTPPPPRRLVVNLTPFDRHVLAVLVAYGGWNATSRAKLVAVAGMQGVSPQGLLKVIAGLGEYSKTGGPRFDVAAITRGAGRFEDLPAAPVANDGLDGSTSWSEKLLPELHRGGIGVTIKLSILFGIAALVLMVALVVQLMDTGDSRSTATPEIAQNDTTATPPPIATRELIESLQRADDAPLAVFPAPPTFHGDSAPREGLDAADRSANLPGQFDELARKLSVAGDPSLATYRDWQAYLEDAGKAWLFTSPAVDDAILDNIYEVIFAIADRPTAADRLLNMLAEPARVVEEPLDFGRGAWTLGVLGELLRRPGVPPGIGQTARRLLTELLGDRRTREQLDFETAARRWLNARRAGLVAATEFDPNIYEMWELWLAAHRKLGQSGSFDEMVMETIRDLARSGTDLARPGPTVNVVGRLLTTADFQGSEVVRDRFLAFYDDPLISGRDLWVLGSILAQFDAAPWFTADLVVGENATVQARARLHDRLLRVWPDRREVQVTSGSRIPVDGRGGARWRRLLQLCIDRDSSGASRRRQVEDLMTDLVMYAWLNQAALSLSRGQPTSAMDAMDRLESALENGLGYPDPPITPRRPGGGRVIPGGGRGVLNPNQPPGQARGVDGRWAERYRAAGRDTEDRLNLLRGMQSSGGSDLGALDAAAFIREVYRGSPMEVRSYAQEILVQSFSHGPVVIMELLDQLPDGPRSAAISLAIEQMTDAHLPATRSEAWMFEARQALLQHLITVRRGGGSAADRLAEMLGRAYFERYRVLAPSTPGSSDVKHPTEEIARVFDAWRDLALALVVIDPSPSDLSSIERRHATRLRLTRGPVQEHVATQVSLLDLLAYVLSAEQPAHADEVVAILTESGRRRHAAAHILEQSIEAELTLARLWYLRIEPRRMPDEDDAS